MGKCEAGLFVCVVPLCLNGLVLCKADLEALRLLIEGGDFKSVARMYFPLAEAMKAFELVKQGTVGKVVITIKEDKGSEIEREFAGAKSETSAINNSDNSNNNNNVNINNNNSNVSIEVNESAVPPAVVRERDLGADDYEDEPTGSNPFAK